MNLIEYIQTEYMQIHINAKTFVYEMFRNTKTKEKTKY